MKKYHIADALTVIECICAVILLGMIFGKTSPDWALWVFVIGELCDAFDGICARRWHYPDDGKYRWWRTYACEIDQISDLALIIIFAFYIIFNVNAKVGWGLGLSIGGFCAVVEVLVHTCFKSGSKARRNIILFRRYIYLVAIAVAIILTIYATSWPEIFKWGALTAAVIIGLALIFIKRNRLTQTKTPL